MEATGDPTPIHPDTLEEKPPEIVFSIYETVTWLVAQNGWYLLALSVVCALLWSRLQPHLSRWQQEREERDEAARRHKNPDLYRSRQLAQEVARLKLQAEHDQRALVAAEKTKEREAAKLQQRIAKQGSQTTGRTLNEGNNQTEFNPLMGGGSSSGFRPTRRPCPGGGCG